MRYHLHRHAVLVIVVGLVVLAGAAPAAFAQNPPEEIEYYATDALGSVRIVFRPNGEVLGRSDYLPFGDTLSQSGALPRQRFTGQERDGEAGMDYFLARNLQARTGRMNAPDPLFGGAPENPQAWNRYSYVVNNPLGMTDPTGMQGSSTFVTFGIAPFGETAPIGLAGGCASCFLAGAVNGGPDWNGGMNLDGFALLNGVGASGRAGGMAIRRFNGNGRLVREHVADSATDTPGDTSGKDEQKETGQDTETPDDSAQTLKCVARNAGGGGLAAAAVGGLAAYGAGRPLLPYSWFGGAASGGGPSGGTSVISAAARGFFGRSRVTKESGSVLRVLADWTGTGSLGGTIGRVASRASVAVGVAVEAYAAYRVFQAYQGCTAGK